MIACVPSSSGAASISAGHTTGEGMSAMRSIAFEFVSEHRPLAAGSQNGQRQVTYYDSRLDLRAFDRHAGDAFACVLRRVPVRLALFLNGQRWVYGLDVSNLAGVDDLVK